MRRKCADDTLVQRHRADVDPGVVKADVLVNVDRRHPVANFSGVGECEREERLFVRLAARIVAVWLDRRPDILPEFNVLE